MTLYHQCTGVAKCEVCRKRDEETKKRMSKTIAELEANKPTEQEKIKLMADKAGIDVLRARMTQKDRTVKERYLLKSKEYPAPEFNPFTNANDLFMVIEGIRIKQKKTVLYPAIFLNHIIESSNAAYAEIPLKTALANAVFEYVKQKDK